MKRKPFLFGVFAVLSALVIETTAAFAAVRPSVNYKEEPEIITNETEIDNPSVPGGKETIEYSVVIVDSAVSASTDGYIQDYVITTHVDVNSYSDFIVGTVSGYDAATKQVQKERMMTAYGDFSNPSRNTQLSSLLTNTAKSYDKSFTLSDLVVTHLFDVKMHDSDLSVLRADTDYRAIIRFDIGVAEDAKMVVLHQNEATGNWIRVPDNLVTNNGDGSLTVYFDDLCPIAFMQVTGEIAPAESCNSLDFTRIVVILLLLLIVGYLNRQVGAFIANESSRRKEKQKLKDEKGSRS